MLWPHVRYIIYRSYGFGLPRRRTVVIHRTRQRRNHIYIYEYKVYVKKNVVWHAPSKTRCSGGLSYTHTCRIPAGNAAAAVVITSYRIMYTYTAKYCRRTTALLTNRFVHRPTQYRYLFVLYILVSLQRISRHSRSTKKKIRTSAVGTTQTTSTNGWPLFEFFRSTNDPVHLYNAAFVVRCLFH